MFFSDKNYKLAANFTLIPLELGNSAKAFKLKYGGKILNFTQDHPINLSWPTEPSIVEAIFMDKKDNFTVIKETGPWAWFKLANNATIINTKDTTQYTLTLSANSMIANYKLIANNIDNPFIPNIISHFRCPQLLT